MCLTACALNWNCGGNGASVLGTTGTEELTAQYVQGSCRYQLVNLPRHTEHHQHIAERYRYGIGSAIMLSPGPRLAS